MEKGKSKEKENENILVGKFFHSFNEDKTVNWQGKVIGQINDNLFLIECFSWILGEQSYSLEIVELNDMKNWFFYRNPKDMRWVYDNKLQYREKNGEKT